MKQLAEFVKERKKEVNLTQGEFTERTGVAVGLSEDEEESALTRCGKKKKHKREHFEQLGEGMGVTTKQIDSSFKRIARNKTKAADWIERFFLSQEMKQRCLETMFANNRRL